MASEEDVVIEGQIIENSWFVSVINGDLKALEKLYKENGGRQDENGCTALMYAANSGYLECVRFLIKNCKNELRKTDNNGRTALMYAAMRGQTEIVKLLVKFEGGATDDSEMTAYDHAVKNGYSECAKILKDNSDDTSGSKNENKDYKKTLDNMDKAGQALQDVINTQDKERNKNAGMGGRKI
jgi:ankyrin repeat protein